MTSPVFKPIRRASIWYGLNGIVDWVVEPVVHAALAVDGVLNQVQFPVS